MRCEFNARAGPARLCLHTLLPPERKFAASRVIYRFNSQALARARAQYNICILYTYVRLKCSASELNDLTHTHTLATHSLCSLPLTRAYVPSIKFWVSCCWTLAKIYCLSCAALKIIFYIKLIRSNFLKNIWRGIFYNMRAERYNDHSCMHDIYARKTHRVITFIIFARERVRNVYIPTLFFLMRMFHDRLPPIHIVFQKLGKSMIISLVFTLTQFFLFAS